GPFRFVRHPIYLFQIVMLAALALLLPTGLSLIAVAIHLVCVVVKVADEETFLLATHGAEYRGYRSRTGKLLPGFLCKRSGITHDVTGPGAKCVFPPETDRLNSPQS